MSIAATDFLWGRLRGPGVDLGFREGGVGVEKGARAKGVPENFD